MPMESHVPLAAQHDGQVTSLEGTESGRLLFTGSEDGMVLAHDLRMHDPTRVLWHHKAGGWQEAAGRGGHRVSGEL